MRLEDIDERYDWKILLLCHASTIIWQQCSSVPERVFGEVKITNCLGSFVSGGEGDQGPRSASVLSWQLPALKSVYTCRHTT
jgi:hypothetical protein